MNIYSSLWTGPSRKLRTRLKIRWPQGRVGSIPSSSTNLSCSGELPRASTHLTFPDAAARHIANSTHGLLRRNQRWGFSHLCSNLDNSRHARTEQGVRDRGRELQWHSRNIEEANGFW